MEWLEHIALIIAVVGFIYQVMKHEAMLPESPRNVVYLDDYRR